MTTAGTEDDFNTILVRLLEGGKISSRNLQLRVQQRSIDIDGYKADAGAHFLNFSIANGGYLRP